jgi:hypothetical protein
MTKANPYSRVGVVDPNYTSSLLPGVREYLSKGSQFNAYNCADRLTGWFLNTFTSSHVRTEVPVLRASLNAPVSKATVDSYIDHLKAIGDGVLAAIGTYRNDVNAQRTAVEGEWGLFCGAFNLLATTATLNYGVLHTSAKSSIFTCGAHNQQTDVYQAGSKFFWFRAEKHFQIQSATSSFYITGAAEDFYNRHYYQAKSYKANIKTSAVASELWYLNSKRVVLDGEKLDLVSKKVNLVGEELNISVKQALNVGSSSSVNISGSQIFLGRRSAPPPKIDRVDVELLPDVDITALPDYTRSQNVGNQQLPVVTYGSQVIKIPPL